MTINRDLLLRACPLPDYYNVDTSWTLKCVEAGAVFIFTFVFLYIRRKWKAISTRQPTVIKSRRTVRLWFYPILPLPIFPSPFFFNLLLMYAITLKADVLSLSLSLDLIRMLLPSWSSTTTLETWGDIKWRPRKKEREREKDYSFSFASSLCGDMYKYISVFIESAFLQAAILPVTSLWTAVNIPVNKLD